MPRLTIILNPLVGLRLDLRQMTGFRLWQRRKIVYERLAVIAVGRRLWLIMEVDRHAEAGGHAMNMQAGPPPNNNRLAAALSYLLGLITGIIFLYLEPYSEDDFVRFHARQSIIFSVAWFAVEIVVGVFIAVMPHPISGLLSFLLWIFNLASAIFWVILMYKAYNGERYRIPELADWAESIGF